MPSATVNVDRVFHALGDATRRAIVEKLSQGPISVSRLAEPLDITLAAVVQHLQILEESGLIQTEKVGRVRTCSIQPTGFSAAEQWMLDRRTSWERRFDKLAELLAEPEAERSGAEESKLGKAKSKEASTKKKEQS